MISDIDKDLSASKLVSVVDDDTRIYSGVGNVTDCDNLQFDLLYMIGHHPTTGFSSKGLVMFVSAPMCMPISKIYILTQRLT